MSDLGATRDRISTSAGSVEILRLDRLPQLGGGDPARLPHTVKILLENLLRRVGTRDVSEADVLALSRWPEPAPDASLAFMPARVLMQDFTGVPAVVDLAAMRSALARAGGDPERVDPVIDVDLVIDHSVQVDRFGTPDAYARNVELEYERNRGAVRAPALGPAGVPDGAGGAAGRRASATR
ncbi:MAG: hypothetical protein KatS3mg014_0863 [Actinomycetota bacterium]|nr:MAG: hypothetical protein KatS3mg014_0863 [Actinomycetota bacterium]